MSSPDGYPDLAEGDANDWVVDLQLRLHTLGVYPGFCDGVLGDRTVAAVRDFTVAYQVGSEDAVVVGPAVWGALLALTPGAATGQDLEQPVDGQLSDDEAWVWSEGTWHPVEHPVERMVEESDQNSSGLPESITTSDQSVPMSEDGHWRWVDNRWQPNA